jgi:DNA polymerase-3 subunit beta
VKITARASSLDAALSLAASATRKGRIAPVIHVIAAADSVSFTCAAPGISVRISVDAKVDEPGSVAVSDRLAALVSGFSPKADIIITVEGDAATVACGRARYRLPVVPGPHSVVCGLADETAHVEMSGGDLLSLLEVLPAAGTEASRFYLSGIFLHNVDDRLVACATDGVKLLRANIVAGTLSKDDRLIVPARAAQATARLVEQTHADVVTLRRSRSTFCVTAPRFELITALIDAAFPDYGRVIPPASGNVVSCVRAELYEALRRLEAVATGTEAALVALSWIDGGPLQLFLPRQPLDATDVISAEARGSSQVALSLPQLRAMVDTFSSDRLVIGSAGDAAPITMRGKGDQLGVLFSCRWNFEPVRAARSGATPNDNGRITNQKVKANV